MSFELFDEEGGFGGPAAAFVGADRCRSRVADPLERLKEPARLDWEPGARVDFLDQRLTIRQRGVSGCARSGGW
ncbi:hypothetical protein, partial [Stenotrophomonas maltophilia]|uniref:hypothetical protein n=1 Tax=Stenotrophomonas maltophilia TaxID=40324 RepID=UPI001C3FFABC